MMIGQSTKGRIAGFPFSILVSILVTLLAAELSTLRSDVIVMAEDKPGSIVVPELAASGELGKSIARKLAAIDRYNREIKELNDWFTSLPKEVQPDQWKRLVAGVGRRGTEIDRLFDEIEKLEGSIREIAAGTLCQFQTPDRQEVASLAKSYCRHGGIAAGHQCSTHQPASRHFGYLPTDLIAGAECRGSFASACLASDQDRP